MKVEIIDFLCFVVFSILRFSHLCSSYDINWSIFNHAVVIHSGLCFVKGIWSRQMCPWSSELFWSLQKNNAIDGFLRHLPTFTLGTHQILTILKTRNPHIGFKIICLTYSLFHVIIHVVSSNSSCRDPPRPPPNGQCPNRACINFNRSSLKVNSDCYL